MRIVRFLLALGAIVLAVSALLPAHAQALTPYAAPGKYAVGLTAFQFNQAPDHRAVLLIWYPALKTVGDQSKAPLIVPDDFQLPSKARLLDQKNWGAIIKDGAPDTSGAPYPLVTFSPGYGGTGVYYSDTEAHLASYGFLVVTTAIPIDTSNWENSITRPVDTSREIDFAESLNLQDGSFKGLIDTRHVGVVGHSAGGYTSLAVGGARFDLAWFEQWCADHGVNPYALSSCPAVLSHKNELLALARLDSMPKDLWPSWRDPRVTGIVSQTGDAVEFGTRGLAEVTIPVMVQVALDDNVVPPEAGASLTYDSVSSAQKAMVIFQKGGHTMFVDSTAKAFPARTAVMRHLTTAFLLDVLKDDKDAHKALLPDAVKFAGLDYKTTMK